MTDIDSIQRVCDVRACEGQFWKVKTVKETRRVKVKGYSKVTTKAAIKEYLERFTISTVDGVDLRLDEGMAIVCHRTQGGNHMYTSMVVTGLRQETN